MEDRDITSEKNANQEVIFKLQSNHATFQKLIKYYAEFLPRVYELIGVEMYVETIEDGAIIFFKTLSDCVKFHQFAEVIILPTDPKNNKKTRKKETIEITVDTIRIPPEIVFDELITGVANCYKIISPDIEVEKISDQRTTVRYKNANDLE